MKAYELLDYARKAVEINGGLYMPGSKGLQFIAKLDDYDSSKCHKHLKEKDIVKIYETEDCKDIDFDCLSNIIWNKTVRTENDEFKEVFNIGDFQVIKGLDGNLFFRVGTSLVKGHMEYDMSNVDITENGQVFLRLTEESMLKYRTQNDMVKIMFIDKSLECIVAMDEKLYGLDDFRILPIDILSDINEEGFLPKEKISLYKDKIKPIIKEGSVKKVQVMSLKDFCLNRNVFDILEDRVCFIKEDKSVAYINKDLFIKYGGKLIEINQFSMTFGAVETEDGSFLPTSMIWNYPSVVEMYKSEKQMKKERKKNSFKIGDIVMVHDKDKGTVIDIDYTDDTYRVTLGCGSTGWYQRSELKTTKR